MKGARVAWRRLELLGFGPFGAGVGVSFGPGLNVLAAPNETGKSTLLAGIQAVLFGLEGGESRTTFSRGRFRSWGAADCVGCLVLETDGLSYLVRRDFDRQRVEVWQGPPEAGSEEGSGLAAGEAGGPWPRGWVQLLAGPHNPRGQRNDPRYQEWLETTLGITGRELFAATFCLGQALLPAGGEAFPPTGDGWALPPDVQVLLAGSGGRTVAEALGALAARLRELTMRPASRFGLPGSDQRRPRRLEELEDRVAALEGRWEEGRRRLDASEGLRLDLARAEAAERESLERLDQLRRTEQAFAERRLALERLRTAEEEQGRLDADWRAWEEGRRQLAEARARLAADFPWAAEALAVSQDAEGWSRTGKAPALGQRLAALCELARERERQAGEEEVLKARRRAAEADLQEATAGVRRWLGLDGEGDLPADWRRRGEERLAAHEELAGGERAGWPGLARTAWVGVAVGLGLALLGWLAGVPRGEAAGLLLALGSALGYLAVRSWLRRAGHGRGATAGPSGQEAAAPGVTPPEEEWTRLATAVEAARAAVGEVAAAEALLAERRRNLEERWRSLAEEVQPVLEAHGGEPEGALAAWNEFAEAARRVESLAAAQDALLARRGAATGEDLRRLLLKAGSEVQERLRAWEELLVRHPGLPGRDEPPEEVEEALRRIRALAEAEAAAVTRAREEMGRLQRALAEAEAAGGDNVARLELELAALREELARTREEAAAVALAHAELAGAYDEYRQGHRERLADLASERFAALTSVPGRRVVLDEAFSVEVREPDGRRCAVSQLSRGAADQLALSLRLAVTDLLSSNLALPLHLDDPFGNFDAGRLEEARRLLQAVAAERQIILVTHRPELLAWGRPVQLEEPVLLASCPAVPRAAAGGGA